jgi:4-amino-4-deoxy-L-arabinose transferase-like glycosyltransferase
VFFVGRRLVGGDGAGCMAGSAYALLSLGPSVLGTSAHATHFVVPLALGGLLLLLRARESRRRSRALLAAALFGLAFVMKQHAVFFPICAAVLAGVWEWRSGERGLAASARRLGGFALALAGPFAATCLLLWWAGVWRTFWFWCFEYARAYVSITPGAEGCSNFRTVFPQVIGRAWPIWLLAGAGLLRLALTRPRLETRGVLVAFTVASGLTVVPGLYFRPHYFVTLLPAVALLAAHGSVAVGRLARRWCSGATRSCSVSIPCVFRGCSTVGSRSWKCGRSRGSWRSGPPRRTASRCSEASRRSTSTRAAARRRGTSTRSRSGRSSPSPSA